jgi:uncharacterized protein involved in response to NO
MTLLHRAHPLWALGFRPFYLLAAVFAALAVPLWVLQYAGVVPPVLHGSVWHGHEMLFGFAMAVIAGFLFTAVRNWTQQPTPAGGALMAIAALWLAARLLAFTPWTVAAGAANALFLFAVAAGIGVPLVKSGNRRNYFFVALLLLAAVAVVGIRLRVGLDIVLFIVAVIAGRVVPMFTNNGVPGAGATRHRAIELAALGSVLALLAADLVELPAIAVIVFAGFAAAAHAVRLALWKPWRTRPNPLVWILHVAYAWIPVHLALRALAAASLVPETLAIHALTIGAIGGMTLGMMTRTARGHTGMPLAGGRAEVACYGLITAAALVRVAGPLVLPSAYLATVVVSAACWSAAYATYAVRYAPLLLRPRADGKPG